MYNFGSFETFTMNCIIVFFFNTVNLNVMYSLNKEHESVNITKSNISVNSLQNPFYMYM